MFFITRIKRHFQKKREDEAAKLKFKIENILKAPDVPNREKMSQLDIHKNLFTGPELWVYRIAFADLERDSESDYDKGDGDIRFV